MSVAIVTDSAAALPVELTERYGITVVPMWVIVGGTPQREDEVDIAALLATEAVSTSGPAPGEFEAAIAERLGPDGVCVLTVSSTMSSTHEAAVLGARQAGGGVRVVDTRTAAGAQALVVLAAARAAARGGDVDEVAAVARDASEHVRLVASVPDLDHLVRSGRVPNLAGKAGRMLGLAPMFEFRDGGARALRPAIGIDAALDRIVARCRRDQSPGASLEVAALHAAAPDAAHALLARVREEHPAEPAFVASFGAVMVAHTGPGLIGLAWRWVGSA